MNKKKLISEIVLFVSLPTVAFISYKIYDICYRRKIENKIKYEKKLGESETKYLRKALKGLSWKELKTLKKYFDGNKNIILKENIKKIIN